MRQVRQGDILLIEINKLPKGAKQVGERGKQIVAYGEATGHAHVIDDGELYECEVKGEPEPVRYLKLVKPTMFKHNTHGDIALPGVGTEIVKPKLYRISRAREYTPQGIKYVAD